MAFKNFTDSVPHQAESSNQYQQQYPTASSNAGSLSEGFVTFNLSHRDQSSSGSTNSIPSYSPTPALQFALAQILVGPVVWTLFVLYIWSKILRSDVSPRHAYPPVPATSGFNAVAFSVLKSALRGVVAFGGVAAGRGDRRSGTLARGGGGRNDAGMTREELAVTKVYAFADRSECHAYVTGECEIEMGDLSQVAPVEQQQQQQENSDQQHDISGQPEMKEFMSSVTCSICLGDYEAGEILRELPCFHAFHMDCIDGWLMDVFIPADEAIFPDNAPANSAVLPSSNEIIPTTQNIPVVASVVVPGPANAITVNRRRRGHRQCPVCKRNIA
ncbi:hypothetical protein HK100_010808 [Physocladia obscura]|uniref:RING-type domain-containing protein n=1 Tax=Physocladia obscura TaxID=109957 RepID=A0AAD5XKB1_9FUNG|nr:hypothetical protein HK100_010808 [Physocladia obscura]